MKSITLIPGDGVGPEVIDMARQCVEASGIEIDWDYQHAGEAAKEKFGSLLPEATINSIRKNKIALKGPLTTPIGEGHRSTNVELRKRFDLFANIRPTKIFPGIKSRYENVDIVVIRENIEDLYIGLEFFHDKKFIDFVNKHAKVKLNYASGISLKYISQKESERIVNFAFEYAKKNKRKKVTALTKANILKYSDGLFLDVARRIAKKYVNIEFQELLVDNACMQLVQEPSQFDAIVAPNLYGDIVSDICAAIVGGVGVVGSSNIGERYAIFEPVHGSAPKYAGKNKVNPCAAILSAAMMILHIGKEGAAKKIENAVSEVIKEGKKVTYDLAKKSSQAVGTKEMAEAIIKKIKKDEK